jgi:glyoxylase-like metal-dependent hydrolase (beta-lactamase superfamily II)
VIKKIHGANIFAHAKALPQLENPLHNGPLRPYQKIIWGKPAPSAGYEIGKTLQTKHHNFEIICTPGHSIDHISLYEPNMGWLFTGDTYIGGLDRALRHDYNIWQIISSLKTLIDLDARLLFPGSGNVRRDPKAELSKKIKYLEEIGDKVMSLYAKGYSLRQIRKTLFGKETFVAYFTLGHFSGKNLVRSYITNQVN